MPQTPLATPAVMDPTSVGTGAHEAEIGSSALVSKLSNESAGRVAVASPSYMIYNIKYVSSLSTRAWLHRAAFGSRVRLRRE